MNCRTHFDPYQHFLMQALGERKEKLSKISQRTSEMEDEANDFSTLAAQLADKYKKKSKKGASKKTETPSESTDSPKKHKGIKFKWSKK